MLTRSAFCCLCLAQAFSFAQKPSLLAVFAHPDDEIWWGAGAMLAMYAGQGHDVRLVTVTSGQLGVTAQAGIPAGPELGGVREEELRCAARALAIHPPYIFGFHDQGIATSLVMDEFARKLRRLIAEVKPEVIVTHGPDGLSGHIDHRITSAVVTEVFQEQERLGYRPRKLYYLAYPESRTPLAPGATDGRRVSRSTSDAMVTTAIDSAIGRAASEQAVDCHKSQMSAAEMAARKAYHRDTLGGVVYLRLAMTTASWPASREDSIFDPPD